MEKGYIRAEVSTASNAIPLIGANVYIMKNDEIISLEQTDQNGFTRPVEVDAPEKALSTSPGNAQPFALYDMKVTYPAFYTIIVRNVQVFGQETTFQKINMLPLPEGQTEKEQVLEFDITPQNL